MSHYPLSMRLKYRHLTRSVVALVAMAVCLAWSGCDKPPPSSSPPAPVPPAVATEEPFVPSSDKVYEDLDYKFKVNAPGAGWLRGGPSATSQLGEVCRAWYDPENPLKTICVHVRSAREEATNEPAKQAEELSGKMESVFNQAVHAAIESNKVLDFGGIPAVSLRMNGEGTGFGIDGLSKLPTRQHWTAIPRGRDVIFAFVSAPTSDFDAAYQVYRGVLKTLSVGSERGPKVEGRFYKDPEYGITVPYPAGDWIRGGYELGEIKAPGEICRIWSSEAKPSNRVLVARQSPGTAYTPRHLLDISVDGLKNSLGAEIVEQGVYTVSGRKAMWLVVKGKGTGSVLDGKGEVPTVQHWVAIPRLTDIIVFILTSPASDYPNMEPVFSRMLSGLILTGDQTAEQQSSK